MTNFQEVSSSSNRVGISRITVSDRVLTADGRELWSRRQSVIDELGFNETHLDQFSFSFFDPEKNRISGGMTVGIETSFPFVSM